MRDHSLVMNERRALGAYTKNNPRPASPEFLRFLRGAVAALDWVTGAAKVAPVSTDTPAATQDTILAEVGHCDALLAGAGGSLTAVRADPHYLNGVEHALRWLLELEAEPPVPFETGTGRAPTTITAARKTTGAVPAA